MQMQSRAGKSASGHQGGFTLIEVMIVVAIVAILAAFAIPQYREYVLRGQLVSATNELSTFQARMERHFQDNRTYLNIAPFTSPCDPAALPVNEHFTITCSGWGANAYTVSAAGFGPTTGFTFTVNQAGMRATTALPPGWGNPCGNRWILKRGQAC